LAISDHLGIQAYPSEMAGALTLAKTAGIDPMGDIAQILLPAGVSHLFPKGKEAQLCIAYNAGITNPDDLNIYYYNPEQNAYLLQDKNKTVNKTNKNICIDVGHASVFTVLNSSAPTVRGDAYAGNL